MASKAMREFRARRSYRFELDSPKVKVREVGIAIREGRKVVARVRWDQVIRLETYKRDLDTMDEIILEIVYVDAGAPLTLDVSEDCPGFSDLLDVLPRRFPGVPGDWFQRVRQPPFAPNFTVLYEHPKYPPG